MKKRIFASVLFMVSTISLFGQEEETEKPLKMSGYAEVYYQYDANNPVNNMRPGFVYSHNRSNEVNLNLGLIKANYSKENYRANLAFGVGTYMNANYAAEPGVLKNIYEANIGVRLSSQNNLWLDAGIMPSHIGFESAIGADCFTLTRSMLADNSPYFETGAKLSYTTTNNKWYFAALVLNGWQRIQRVDGNTTPAFGHQITFKPNDMITLNSSSFIGNDQPDVNRLMRYFHNFYGQFQLDDNFTFIVGFDIGVQQQEKGSSDYDTWYSPVLITKYNVTNQFSITARGEYYQDKAGVIIPTDTENGFKTFGFSINSDYKIFPNLMWRTEIKNLNSKDAIFIKENETTTQNSFIAVTGLTLSI